MFSYMGLQTLGYFHVTYYRNNSYLVLVKADRLDCLQGFENQPQSLRVAIFPVYSTSMVVHGKFIQKSSDGKSNL